MSVASKLTTAVIPGQDEMTYLAIRFGASWIEDLTEGVRRQNTSDASETVADEERFKFAVLIDERQARAYLHTITLGSNGSATGTALATVIHSPILAYQYVLAVWRENGEWKARVEDSIRINND